MWIVFALLSAVFAALTSIFAKIGIDGVNSNLATAVRTVVVVVMSWLMVFITNNQSGLAQISSDIVADLKGLFPQKYMYIKEMHHSFIEELF